MLTAQTESPIRCSQSPSVKGSRSMTLREATRTAAWTRRPKLTSPLPTSRRWKIGTARPSSSRAATARPIVAPTSKVPPGAAEVVFSIQWKGEMTPIQEAELTVSAIPLITSSATRAPTPKEVAV